MQVILEDKFYSHGRGPELQKIHWRPLGTQVDAIGQEWGQAPFSTHNHYAIV